MPCFSWLLTFLWRSNSNLIWYIIYTFAMRMSTGTRRKMRGVVDAQHGRERMGFKSPTGGQYMKLCAESNGRQGTGHLGGILGVKGQAIWAEFCMKGAQNDVM